MSKVKDGLGIALQMATIISLVALPLILHRGQVRSEQRIAAAEHERQYVHMAMEILRSPATGDTDRTRLRSWALEIVASYAPIKLPDELRNDILKGGMFPPGYFPDGWFPPGYFPDRISLGDERK